MSFRKWPYNINPGHIRYIRVNQKIADIINFIHKQLLLHTPIGSAALQENYGKMPISILSGDFSINFASDDSVLLVDFLREKLNLTMNNNPNEQQQGQGMELLSMPSSKDALINQNRGHFQLISAITNQMFYF